MGLKFREHFYGQACRVGTLCALSSNPHHHPMRRVTVLPLVYSRENEGTERLVILTRSDEAVHVDLEHL